MIRDAARKEQVGRALADFAAENNATHFLTLKPGLHGLRSFDMDRELRPIIGAWLREFGRIRNNLPHRLKVRAEHLPFVVGVPERWNGSGNIDPHFHCMIALRDGEEALLRGHARLRWGADMTAGADDLPAGMPAKGDPASVREFLVPQQVSSRPDHRRWLLKGERYSPSFDLQAMTSARDRVGIYMTKQISDPNIWTHPELLENAHTLTKRENENPSKIRA